MKLCIWTKWQNLLEFVLHKMAFLARKGLFFQWWSQLKMWNCCGIAFWSSTAPFNCSVLTGLNLLGGAIWNTFLMSFPASDTTTVCVVCYWQCYFFNTQLHHSNCSVLTGLRLHLVEQYGTGRVAAWWHNTMYIIYVPWGHITMYYISWWHNTMYTCTTQHIYTYTMVAQYQMVAGWWHNIKYCVPVPAPLPLNISA